MKGGDWDGAAYMMAHALECALKAAACKILGLEKYPQDVRKDGHFMTHDFDQLLILSGLSGIFSANGAQDEFLSWSEFTKEFPGNWVSVRYSLQNQQKFDEVKVYGLFAYLAGNPSAILRVLSKRKKW